MPAHQQQTIIKKFYFFTRVYENIFNGKFHQTKQKYKY